MSDEASLLLATCKGDPAGFESVISAGALPFALIVDFLVHVDSWERHISPASQHVPTLWHGILKGCERTLQKAPYGHVLAQPLLLSLCQLASTGHCTPLVPLQSLLKGICAAPASLPIGQVWSLYAALWPREVLWASGLAQPEGTSKSLQEQTEEALGTLDFEERLALDSLQSLVAVLQSYSITDVDAQGGKQGGTKTKALPAHAKLDAAAAHKLYLQAVSMCCRCVRLGAEECVLLARASLGLDSAPDAGGTTTTSSTSGAEHSAASKSQKKRQKRKEKEKSVKAPAAGSGPAPAPVARAQPLVLDLVPISASPDTAHTQAGRVQQVYSALAASKAGAATKMLLTPVDGLFAYQLGLCPIPSQGKEGTVQGQDQQQQVAQWVEAWAAATKACLLEDRLAQVSVAHGTFVSSTSLAGEEGGSGLGDFLVYATAQRSALTAAPSTALGTVSLRAVHAAVAARFAVGLAALQSPPLSGQGFGLPTTAIEASLRLLADKHKLTLHPAGSTATPSLSALELEAIDQDASLAEELNEEDQAWVESVVPALMPPEPKGPALEGVVRQYVRLAAGLAAAHADSGDIDAARQAHRSCFWWLAEHMLAPIHAAAGEGGKTGGCVPLGDGYHACVEQCLHTWAAFEDAHGMSAEELDYPLLHLQDLRRSGASQAARQISLSYAEAARCAAVEVVKACKRAVLVHAKEKERAADTAAAATIAAVQRAKEANKEREAKQTEERAKQQEAEQAKGSKGKGGGNKGKGDKKAFAAVPATAAPSAAPVSQPPPPPSMASLKAQTDAAAAAASDTPPVPAQPSLDTQAVLARVQAAARAGGQLGFLPQAGFPPIPDLDD